MAEPIRVFEVGARDGLQNEPNLVSTADKAWFIAGLVDAGVRDLELGAFVRSDRVPQMADTEKLYGMIDRGELKLGRARGWSLVPNTTGLERANACGARDLAVFTAASETFNQRNIGMSVAKSLAEIKRIVFEAPRGTRFRGYVSTAFGCPFEGKIKPAKTLKVVEALADLGIEEISIGDTIGVATPDEVDGVVKPARKILGRAAKKGLAVHFHDTRGTALANALRSIELGVRVIDSSAGGLGGCPFAPGATGNLATEDLVYMLDGMGLKSGIDLEKLCRVSLEMSRRMNRPLSSRYLQAFAARCAR